MNFLKSSSSFQDSDFRNDDWKVRFSAVERAVLVCQFLDSDTVRQNSVLQSILSNVFCFLVGSMDDDHAAVATRATILIDCVHDLALKLVCWCLEQQFDSFVADRPLLLHAVMALNHQPSLSKRKIVTWKFFYRRFDALFVEAQLSLQREDPSVVAAVRDLANSEASSPLLAEKVAKARSALKRIAPPDSPTVLPKTLMRSLSLLNNAASGANCRGKSGGGATSGGVAGRQPAAGSSNISFERADHRDNNKEKSYSRQGSMAQLKVRGGRFTTDIGARAGQSQMTQGTPQDDAFVALLLHRFADSDDFDGETLSLLVSALMQFLSQPDLANAGDDKLPAPMRNLVLKHLSLLLGYSPADRAFCFTPQKLRSVSVLVSVSVSINQLFL